MAEMDLNALFSRTRSGDKEAFALVYHQLKQPVFTIAYRIVQSREMAEDIAHDVFVKLFLSPPDPSVKNLRAWIFQMARNLSIDALRKNQRTCTFETQAHSIPDFNSIDLRLDLESAIGALPQDEREVLSLHLAGELPFRQVARIMGISLPATYRKYRKALNTLQDLLNGGNE